MVEKWREEQESGRDLKAVVSGCLGTKAKGKVQLAGKFGFERTGSPR